MLIDRAHQANVPVFFLQHANEKIKMAQGSDAWRLHPRLQPVETDRIIPKHHSSAFEETTLAKELETLESTASGGDRPGNTWLRPGYMPGCA